MAEGNSSGRQAAAQVSTGLTGGVGQPAEPFSYGGVRGWFAVGVLTALYACSFIDRQILAFMVEMVKHDLGLTDTQMSILIGPTFAFFLAVLGLPMGAIADRHSRKRLIIAGVTAWSLFTAACGFANSFFQLLLARMGVGIGEATLGPGAYSMISDYFRPQQLARALSVFGIGVVAGSGLASLIGGFLIAASASFGAIHLPLVGQLKPWQLVFIVVALPGFVLALIMMLVREPPRRVRPQAELDEPGRGLRFQLRRRNRAYAAIMGGFGLFAMFGFGAGSWLPTYLIRVHHMPIQTIGLILGLATMILGSTGTIVAGTINDRLVAKGRPDAPFMVGTVIGIGFLTGGLIMSLGPSVGVVIGGIIIFCMFGGTWSGVAAAAIQIITPATMRGRVSAVHLIITNAVGLGLGPLLVALATDYLFADEQAIGKAIALLGCIAVPAGIVLLRSGRRQYLQAVGEGPA